MGEQQDVVGDLEAAGMLAGTRWAYRSAVERTLETYSEADGHDAGWLGTTRFVLFRDRLDRVFACERYALSSGNPAADLDLLYAELTQLDIDTMPSLHPDLVRRADLNSSPGWALVARRFLLQSCDFGELDTLPWPQKSPTKQQVAAQPDLDPLQRPLFEMAEGEADGPPTVAAATPEPGLVTFVIAHTLEPVNGHRELVVGRPRLNGGGGQAWHWRQNLLGAPPADGGRRADIAPQPTGPSEAPDAPVRLRRQPGERRDDRAASGQ